MRIACVATKGFEDAELSEPRKALEQAGHEVVVISPRRDEIAGERGQVKVEPDKAIDEVRADEFDALFIPGGFSPDRLRADDRFVRFTRDFDRAGKPILAICHGPQLLFTADVLGGRTVTAWQTIQHDLKAAGLNVVDREVVVDGSLVTSRKPDDIPAFNKAILGVLQARASARASAGQTRGQPSATLH